MLQKNVLFILFTLLIKLTKPNLNQRRSALTKCNLEKNVAQSFSPVINTVASMLSEPVSRRAGSELCEPFLWLLFVKGEDTPS